MGGVSAEAFVATLALVGVVITVEVEAQARAVLIGCSWSRRR